MIEGLYTGATATITTPYRHKIDLNVDRGTIQTGRQPIPATVYPIHRTPLEVAKSGAPGVQAREHT